MPGQVLQMPYQQFPSIGLLSGSLQANMGGFPGFKFQSRRECIDWRRFSAIDVDRVARELDVATLQENINSITFCNFDSEKCPYCQQPVDPVLLKVLKMAQLTIEYLLHSQEYLSSNMAMMEERLQATVQEHEQTKKELGKMAEELKAVKEESKKRKNMISSQQLLLQAGAINYHKCQLCDKAFTNYSYLQCHVERRHPEITEIERDKKKQVMQMEDGIEELKLKLKQTQELLEEEKAAGQRRRLQESEEIARQMEDTKKDIEKLKEEERTRFQQEMDSMKQLLLTEFRSIESKNSTLEEKIKELASRKVATSNLGNIHDDEDGRHERHLKQKERQNRRETFTSEVMMVLDSQNKKIEELASRNVTTSNLGNIHDDEDGRHERQLTQKELQNLRETFASEKSEWKQKLKDLKKIYQQEREELIGENERLRATFSKDQKGISEYLHQQIASLKSQLNDQAKDMKSQQDMIKVLTENKTEVIPVFKTPKRKGLKEEVGKKDEDDGVEIEEETEEEEETDNELEHSFDKNHILLEALRLNPNFIKQLRPDIEEELVAKMKKMGVKKTARGISTQTFRNLKAILQTKQQQRAVKSPEITSLRAKLTKEVARRVKQVQRGDSFLPLQPFKDSIKSQRSHPSQPPTPKEKKVKVVKLKPHPSEPPKPSPRSKVPSPSNTARIVTPAKTRPSTPPFTSEEESMGDKGYLTSPRPNKPGSNRQIQLSPRIQVEEINYDDWSDTDISEVDASPMSTGPSVGRTNQGSLVNSMARSLEKQLSGPRDRPFGGVPVISGPAAASTPSGNVVRKLQVSDDSDLEISSFDEITEQLDIEEKPKPSRGPQPSVRQSADSAGSQATSTWSSSSPRTGW